MTIKNIGGRRHFISAMVRFRRAGAVKGDAVLLSNRRCLTVTFRRASVVIVEKHNVKHRVLDMKRLPRFMRTFR